MQALKNLSKPTFQGSISFLGNVMSYTEISGISCLFSRIPTPTNFIIEEGDAFLCNIILPVFLYLEKLDCFVRIVMDCHVKEGQKYLFIG